MKLYIDIIGQVAMVSESSIEAPNLIEVDYVLDEQELTNIHKGVKAYYADNKLQFIEEPKTVQEAKEELLQKENPTIEDLLNFIRNI